MIRSVARRALGTVTAASAVLLMTLPAVAAPVTLFDASDFYVPRPAASSDQVGVERPLDSFDLEANGFGDLIGTSCVFTITATNGDSVHPYNYGVLRTGDEESDIYGTENQPNVDTTTLEDPEMVLGPTIDLYNVMLPDDDGIVATSVNYVVTVDCEVDQTTTTTGPTTTTTEPSTTTSTTPPPTTAPGPTTSTTSNLTTTTSLHNDTTSTTGGTSDSSSTTLPPVTGSTLPFTGPVEAAGVAMAAAALLLLGAGVLMAAKQQS